MNPPTDERGRKRISVVGKVHCHCCGSESQENAFFAGALEAAREPNGFASAIAQALQPALPCLCAHKGHCYKCNRCGEHCECEFVHGPKMAYLLTHKRPVQISPAQELPADRRDLWDQVRIAAAEWMDDLCEDGVPFEDRASKYEGKIFELVMMLLYGPNVFDFYNEMIDL